MKLSVVIPAYNRERTVGRTVESVLGCGAPAEVVVLHGGRVRAAGAVEDVIRAAGGTDLADAFARLVAA